MATHVVVLSRCQMPIPYLINAIHTMAMLGSKRGLDGWVLKMPSLGLVDAFNAAPILRSKLGLSGWALEHGALMPALPNFTQVVLP